ncbi:hypothetical protein LCGC14_1057590 [marine sediment metagenome]|uniref:Uncharacterized protein n=1 Tax=marine sediment metagenome TaxID=412755 RepID=A0A0F9QT35_9ZZZZ
MEFYSASVMDVVIGIVKGEFFLIPVITAAILALFKIVPNNKIQAAVGKFARFIARSITLNASKWKYTKHFWNRVIEPWFIDLIENTFATFVREFVVGLRSDNEE